MKILVTGAAGFIGFHLVKSLLKNKKNLVIGVDSLNNYYSQKIKNTRNSILKKKKIFFIKIDLSKSKLLDKIFDSHQIDIVIHLAGQPEYYIHLKNQKVSKY